jgi:preprotein translocase subunit SecG
MSVFFAIVLSLLAIFMILLVLVQRGRGGGLAGALGGMGGSSAFGAKAGDVFTRITIVTATVWIIVCVMAVYWAGHQGDALGSGGGAMPAESSPLDTVPPAGGGATAPRTGATAPPAEKESAATAPTTTAPETTAPTTSAPAGGESTPSAPAESAPADGK